MSLEMKQNAFLRLRSKLILIGKNNKDKNCILALLKLMKNEKIKFIYPNFCTN